RVPLSNAGRSFEEALPSLARPMPAATGGATKVPSGVQRQIGRWEGEGGSPTAVGVEEQEAAAPDDRGFAEIKRGLRNGSVVIAAITSCTNTSNPSVMVAAGLLAKNAVERGLKVPPYVKTSLAPGSRVITDYLNKAGLSEYLDQLGFQTVGYGCTTCIGNSGPLPEPIANAIEKGDLVAAAVLSGNRNFEGRINPHVKANYLASPPLVVAYALAGTMDINLVDEPLGTSDKGEPVHLKDIWPSQQEVNDTVASSISPEMFQK